MFPVIAGQDNDTNATDNLTQNATRNMMHSAMENASNNGTDTSDWDEFSALMHSHFRVGCRTSRLSLWANRVGSSEHRTVVFTGDACCMLRSSISKSVAVCVLAY